MVQPAAESCRLGARRTDAGRTARRRAGRGAALGRDDRARGGARHRARARGIPRAGRSEGWRLGARGWSLSGWGLRADALQPPASSLQPGRANDDCARTERAHRRPRPVHPAGGRPARHPRVDPRVLSLHGSRDRPASRRADAHQRAQPARLTATAPHPEQPVHDGHSRCATWPTAPSPTRWCRGGRRSIASRPISSRRSGRNRRWRPPSVPPRSRRGSSRRSAASGRSSMHAFAEAAAGDEDAAATTLAARAPPRSTRSW